MPIYQYRCEACQHTCEVIRKFSDPPLLTCPSCGADAMRKLMAAVGVIFKGSGFHKNDYSATGANKTGSSPKPVTPTTSDAKTGETAAAPASTSNTEASAPKTDSSSTSSGDKPSSGSSDKVA